jgi:hypothetical protein
MADDKTQQGSGDRRRVAGGQAYEVDYFARKHGISIDQAQALIAEHGNDRDRLDAAAQALTQNG